MPGILCKGILVLGQQRCSGGKGRVDWFVPHVLRERGQEFPRHSFSCLPPSSCRKPSQRQPPASVRAASMRSKLQRFPSISAASRPGIQPDLEGTAQRVQLQQQQSIRLGRHEQSLQDMVQMLHDAETGPVKASSDSSQHMLQVGVGS